MLKEDIQTSTVETNDRIYDTGIKLEAGYTYRVVALEKRDLWRDWFVPANAEGLMIPDIILSPFTWMYEKIFSRRKFFPAERLGVLLYTVGDLGHLGLTGRVGRETMITIPKEYKGSHTLFLFVNDYNTGNIHNNKGTIDVMVHKVSRN